MGIIKFLDWLDQKEFKLGQIYRKLCELFAQDPGIVSLFRPMSQEKFSRSDKLKLAIKLAIKSSFQFHTVNLNPEHLVAINLHLDQFKLILPQPSLEQALQFALSLESDQDQTALIQSVSKSNPEIAGLMKNLDDSRERNYQALREFALQKNSRFLKINRNPIPDRSRLESPSRSFTLSRQFPAQEFSHYSLKLSTPGANKNNKSATFKRPFESKY